ncbi:hypothetical protein StoSoilB19_12010 [Arthrobacter sp. StoSoilB19]|nr:hypothetical protein StoSoilB19_12010 [Arthrobacter sp. StoSoilB19]
MFTLLDEPELSVLLGPAWLAQADSSMLNVAAAANEVRTFFRYINLPSETGPCDAGAERALWRPERDQVFLI